MWMGNVSVGIKIKAILAKVVKNLVASYNKAC